MVAIIVALALLGIIISLYGMFVENKIRKDMNYHAACDISNTISCSKSFVSPYNKLLGISNISACLMFYTLMFFFGMTDNIDASLILSWIGFIGTLMFAYVLYFKVKTVCLICTSMYVINIVLLIVHYVNW